MAQEVLNGPLVVKGRLTPESLDIPAGSLVNAAVAATADILATKLRHQHSANFAIDNSDDTAAAATRVIHCAYAVGEVIAFEVGLVTLCTGDAEVTVDCQINGTTCLSSVVTLDSGDTARTLVAATVDPAADDLAAGDVIEIVVTVDAGAGALGAGVFGRLVTREKAA